jgi:ParB-like chromosome segregation protein Spo0J
MQKHITIPEDHSIAAMFPLLEQVDLNELAASIERNGQRRPIILFQGKIIEGRNRARACALAGVTPRTEEYDPTQHGTSILQLVLDENLHRRHLTPSQRAIIAAEAVKAYQAEAAMRATGKIDPPNSNPTKTFGDGTLIEDDEDALLDDDEDDDDSMGATIVRKPGDDDDDDDDMVAPDDVEEDLSKILKDRLASEDLPAEEDEVPDNEERSTGDDELQPKRADELLCNSCFLLVRKNAPMCPIGDDACPVFVK